MAKRLRTVIGGTRAEREEFRKSKGKPKPRPKFPPNTIEKFKEWSGGEITTESIQKGLSSSSPLWRKRARIVAGKMPLK